MALGRIWQAQDNLDTEIWGRPGREGVHSWHKHETELSFMHRVLDRRLGKD